MRVSSFLRLSASRTLWNKQVLFQQRPSAQVSFLKKGLDMMKQQKDQLTSNEKSIASLEEESEIAKSRDTLKASKRTEDSTRIDGNDEQQSEEAAMMRAQQMQDELEFEDMSNQQRALQALASEECNIPFKVYGMLKMPKTKAAYMPERVFAQHRIPKFMVVEHLKKIYLGTLHSIVSIDEEFLNEYLETNFATKLIEKLKELKAQGFTLEVYRDTNGIRGDPITEEAYLGDMVLVRGLDADRSKNLGQSDYHVWRDIDDMGLVVYTPNYLSEPTEFIDPARNKTIYDDYKKVVMRAMLYVKNPFRIRITKPDGTEIQVDETLHTWEHLALFETQMKAPPQFKSDYKLENYMEWLGKFNFGVWKMADLDNWNQGNPLIKQGNNRDKYKDDIFKNSKYDPEVNIDIKNV